MVGPFALGLKENLDFFFFVIFLCVFFFFSLLYFCFGFGGGFCLFVF